MQDRVIFRFWDTKEHVMLDWDCICQTAFNCTRKEGNEIQRYGLMYFVFTTPQRFIPLQCTGLRDKTGKLIFEGDVVADISSGCVATIEYLSSSYSLMAHIRRMDDFIPIEEICYTEAEGTPFEVIGNIYQNPGLLEDINADIQS